MKYENWRKGTFFGGRGALVVGVKGVWQEWQAHGLIARFLENQGTIFEIYGPLPKFSVPKT